MDDLFRWLFGLSVTALAGILGFIGVGYGRRISALERTLGVSREDIAALKATAENTQGSLERIERKVDRLVAWHLPPREGSDR